MDTLRENGFYLSRMRLRAEPELIATVRWYKAPPGALYLPVPHTFASMVWETDDRDYPSDDLGEIAPPQHRASSVWGVRSGVAPQYTHPSPGQHTPTPLDWFVNGVPADVPDNWRELYPPCEVPPDQVTHGKLIASGGVVVRGAAGFWSSAPFSPSGGVVIGGAGTRYVVQRYTARGGSVVGGSAGFAATYILTAAGGLVATGLGALTSSGYLIAKGGLWAGGSAQFSATYILAGAGGLKAGGAALGVPYLALAAAGGVKVGGAGSLYPSFFIAAAGGVKAGGAGRLYTSFALAAAGGVKAGGAGRLYTSFALAAAGGVKAGGAGAITSSWYLIASGGVLAGGAAGLAATHFLTGLGGVKVSGAAALAATHVIAAAGGVKVGGAALLVQLRQLVAAGGVKVGGAGTMEVESMIGEIKLLAFASAPPAGWLFCGGQAVSRATYPALFSLIGTTYGAGDGTTTFNVPDLRGRSPMGDGSGPGLTVRTAGQQVGEESHVLTTAEMPSHAHGVWAGGDYSAVTRGSDSTFGFGGATLVPTWMTAAAGSGAAHNNVTPALVLRAVIRAL